MVRAVFPDEADDIKDYTDACRVAVEHMDVDEKVTNILVAHQFVTGAVRSESEENVGGLDNVDVSVLWRWGIYMGRRRWAGRLSDTVEHRLSIHFRRLTTPNR